MKGILLFIFYLIILSKCYSEGPSYFVYDSLNSPLKSNYVSKVFVDNLDKIWILNIEKDNDNNLINKIYKFDNHNWTILEDNPYISSNITITDLKVSLTGSLWLVYNSSKYGISKYTGDKWENFRNGDSTNGWNGISSFRFIENNRIIAGTWRGLLIIDSTFNFLKTYTPPRIQTQYIGIVNEVLVTKDNILWFTMSGNQGLYQAKIDSNNQIILLNWFNKENSIVNFFDLFNLVQDQYKNICFNSIENDLTSYCLMAFNNDTFKIVQRANNSDEVMRIIGLDKYDRLFCQWFDFLVLKDLQQNFEVLYGPHNKTFTKCKIFSMAFDSKNNLWFGTDIGLVVFNILGLNNVNSVNDNNRNENEKKLINYYNILNISPNPANDYIEIIYNVETGLRPASTKEINIYNILGECVLSEKIHPITMSYRMNIEHLPSGVYYVRLGSWVGSFVKIE